MTPALIESKETWRLPLGCCVCSHGGEPGTLQRVGWHYVLSVGKVLVGDLGSVC